MKKNFLHLLLLLVFSCLSAVSYAYDFTLQGYLLLEGAPFAGGQIYCYNSGNDPAAVVIADENGYYSQTFSIADGSAGVLKILNDDFCTGITQIQEVTAFNGVLELNIEFCGFIGWQACQASFYYYQENPLTRNVLFQDASWTPVTSTAWAWDFGDGTTSSAQNPQHTYAADGLYIVTLTTTADTCTSTLTQEVYVWVDPALGQCQASFWGYQDDPANYLQVAFFDYSYGVSAVTGWAWDFGDGATSTEQNPLHTYAGAGEYNVTVAITTAGGCTVSYAQPLQVYNFWGGCFAWYSYEANAANPQSIQFTNQSEGEIVTLAWDFGDGQTSTEANPAHAYEASGYYLVTLIVTTTDGCSNYFCDYVCVGNCGWGWEQCYASFYYNVDPADTLTVYFTDQSYGWNGQVTDWNWDFGDGDTGAGQYPAHTYAQGGVYDVALTITTSDSCTSSTVYQVWVGNTGCICPEYYNPVCVTLPDGTVQTFDNECFAWCSGYQNYYYCGEGEVCGASFWSSPFDMSALSIQFTDASWGNTNSWLWDFGDGAFSNEQNPVHTYAAEGVYVVSLTTSTADSCSSFVKYEIYVGESIYQGECQAFFWFEQEPGDLLSFNFVNQSFGDFISWNWDFGDGNVSTEANPSHTYSTEGTYMVNLSAVSADGCASSYSLFVLTDMSVWYNSECQALFVPAIEGLNVAFYDQSWGNVVSRNWDFGDGTGSTEDFPNKSYQQPGIYQVKLSITTAAGCVSEFVTIVNLTDGLFSGDASSSALLVNQTQEPAVLRGLRLSPNPASEVAKLDFSSMTGGEVRIDVFSATGQAMLERQMTTGTGAQSVELPVQDLVSGFYFVKITYGSESHTLKMVVE